GLDEISGLHTLFVDLIGTTEVRPVLAQFRNLRTNGRALVEGIDETLNERIRNFHIGAHRYVTSLVHHHGLGICISQVKSNLEGGIHVLAVGAEIEAINAEHRSRRTSRTSREWDNAEFITESFSVIAHCPVTIHHGS